MAISKRMRRRDLTVCYRGRGWGRHGYTSRRMQSRCRQLRVLNIEILPGLGHACYVEGPDLFNSVLSKHLERNA